MTISTISPAGLADLLSSGRTFDLIDVRAPMEYAALHVAGAKNVPLDQLDPVSVMQGRGDQTPLYVICQGGSRGKEACGRFIRAGHANVINVEGGTLACETAGLPVVRGKQAVSLERQVRIAAGSLVLLGAVLGYFVHPYFVGLSAFVGAGLLFSGITDTCGMAMMLAKMPWNKCRGRSCSA